MSFAEERLQREQEEEKLLQQYQDLKNAEALLQEQVLLVMRWSGSLVCGSVIAVKICVQMYGINYM